MISSTVIVISGRACFFFAHQIEKSHVLPWVRNLISYPRAHHWLYMTSQNFFVKQHHTNIRMTLVLFKMVDEYGNARYLKVKLNFKASKVCKKKKLIYICG